MVRSFRETARKAARAGALAVICLSGCAASHSNVRPQAEIPRQEGVTEEGDHLISVGCSDSRDPSIRRSEAELSARVGLARALPPGRKVVSATLTGLEFAASL